MSVAKNCINGTTSKLTVVMGAQFGLEGKQKLIARLANLYQLTVKYNGGTDEQYTIGTDEKKFILDILPCGILLKKGLKNVIGNGAAIHLQSLGKQLKIMQQLKIPYKNKLYISQRAHLVTNLQLKGCLKSKRNSDLSYSMKINRSGLRMGELTDWKTFSEKYHKMAKLYKHQIDLDEIIAMRIIRDQMVKYSMIVNIDWVRRKMHGKNRILVEGANASLFDVDLGIYPDVVPTSCTIGAVCSGLSINHKQIQTVIGVAKAYTARYDGGFLPTQDNQQLAQHSSQKTNQHYDSDTNKNKCGWLDLPMIRYNNMINGYDSLCVTELNALDNKKEIKVGVGYEIRGQPLRGFPSSIEDFKKVEVKYKVLPGWQSDTTKVKDASQLPENAKNYLEFIENNTGVPISWVSTCSEADKMFLFR